jgi:hypothetical protein
VTFAAVIPILGSVETPELFEEPTYDPAGEPPQALRRSGASLWGLGERATWVAGLVLALSALTGWYVSSGDGVPRAVIGWHTGLLGKAVLVIGIAAILVVVLRQFGFALSTIFVLVRAISIPDEFFGANRGVGLWITLAAAVALIGAGLLQASEEL